LHPIVVTPTNELVAGQRRVEAYKKLGHKKIPCVVVSGLDNAVELIVAERDENTCRRDFSPREAVALGKVLEALERPKAKARQSEAGKQHGRGKIASDQIPEPFKGQTRDKVGRAVGMGGTTYSRARAVVEAAESDPDTFGEIAEEMDRTGNVGGAYDRVKAIKDAVNSHGKRKDAMVGVGVVRANEAINCLKKIPPSDRLRKRGFEIVEDWLKNNL
jgi:ParB family chromosome partitioning protein